MSCWLLRLVEVDGGASGGWPVLAPVPDGRTDLERLPLLGLAVDFQLRARAAIAAGVAHGGAYTFLGRGSLPFERRRGGRCATSGAPSNISRHVGQSHHACW